MKKKAFILSKLVLVLLLFVACEEYYTPDLEVVPGMLVIESHLTNDPNQNFVRLSLSKNFYSSSLDEKIVGAKVELISNGGETIRGIESSLGYFIFPIIPVALRTYQLAIQYQNDTYESAPVIMPPAPRIDSLYTNHIISKSYRTDAYGSPILFETPGREICIDAPISSSLEYYRFNCRAVIQWVVPPPPIPFAPPPLFGWTSIDDDGLFKITGPKPFSFSDKIKKYPIRSLAYDAQNYLDASNQTCAGWIIIIDQYGTSHESYVFHEKLNKQFSADGSLFDPVLSQVNGNIYCKTNPEKIVLGFFDMNSYRQYRYFLKLGNNENDRVIQRRLNQYFDIPDEGSQYGFPPAFWEN